MSSSSPVEAQRWLLVSLSSQMGSTNGNQLTSSRHMLQRQRRPLLLFLFLLFLLGVFAAANCRLQAARQAGSDTTWHHPPVVTHTLRIRYICVWIAFASCVIVLHSQLRRRRLPTSEATSSNSSDSDVDCGSRQAGSSTPSGPGQQCVCVRKRERMRTNAYAAPSASECARVCVAATH